MARPKPPKVFDITPEGYHEHNRYFNEAEKIFDEIEQLLRNAPVPPEEIPDMITKILVGVKEP